MIEQAIPFLYLAAAVSFVLSLKWLSSVSTARRGVIVGIAGMALAVGGTLLRPEIVSYRWIGVAFVVGAVIGVRPVGDSALDYSAAAATYLREIGALR